MLVLKRRVNQEIRIGENIVITVLGVSGRSVKLGFDAPPEIKIVRPEIDGGDDEQGPKAGRNGQGPKGGGNGMGSNGGRNGKSPRGLRNGKGRDSRKK